MFIARYPGTCQACEERIKVGDECRYVATEVVHEECSAIVKTPKETKFQGTSLDQMGF